MHQAVFTVAFVWMTGLVAFLVWGLTRARTVMTRILILDVLTLMLTALLILYADATRQSYYLDAAIALALLSFIGTIAAARFQSERRLF
ncbi:MAG: pH regulation protein F [Thermomicrobiales bacterium]|nr:pH regulation protein F [Thermomicrobiales bacterium]